MKTTLFDRAADHNPTAGPVNWADLVSLLYTHALTKPHPGPIALGPRWREDEAAWKRVKVTMPAWSPAWFVGTRSNANVTSHSLFVADLDEIPEAVLSTVRARLAALGWSYVLQPTPTDATHARRYRLIVPYDAPIPVGRVKEVRDAAASLLRLSGDAVDPATKDPSRLYFLPCLTDRGVPPVTESLPGVPIDTETVLRAAGVDLLSSRWPARGRHEAQLALAGGLVKAGIAEAEALEILCDVCRGAGDEDRPKRAEAVRRAVELHAACEPLRGWRFLSTVLSSHVVACARAFLGAEGSTAPKTSIVVSARLHETVRMAMKALGGASGLYRKDYRLVRVIHDYESTGEVAPTIQAADVNVLRSILASVATFVRERATKHGIEYVEIVPPIDVVAPILSWGEWEHVPPLTGILSAPTMRSDGTIFATPGYDEATGYVFEGMPPSSIPDAPTADDARDALDRLVAVFADFPFAAHSGPYVTIAAALTLFARAAFAPTPAFVFEASTRGSGKTKLADVVSIIATGRTAERTSFAGAHDPETEKLLCSAALEGRQILLFDNVTQPFGGASIDKSLTAEDRVSFRLLGANQMRSPKWRTLIMATGNNVDLCADTSSRTLMVRLESPHENPEDRTDFHEPDLLGAVRRDRADHARDCLTILRAWAMAGKPQAYAPKGVAGRFPGWASVVPQALAFAGAPDICAEASARASDVADVRTAALRSLFTAFAEAFPRGALVKQIVKACWPPNGMPTKHPELAEALETLCEADNGKPPSPTKIGSTIRMFRGRVIGSRVLIDRKDTASEARVWSVLDRSSPAALTLAAE